MLLELCRPQTEITTKLKNSQFVKNHPRSVRVILPLLCGVALLLLAAPARAAITLVDNETNASTFGNTSTALLLTTNLTVSASANTLVVVVTFRNTANSTEAPSTLNWTNATTT